MIGNAISNFFQWAFGEALGKILIHPILEKLGVGASDVTEKTAAGAAAGVAAVSDEVKNARRAVAILLNPDKVDEGAGENFRKVVWEDPDFEPFRDDFEVALENLLERFEAKGGAFANRGSKTKTTTRTRTRDQRTQTQTERTVVEETVDTPHPDFLPEKLFIEALEKNGTNPRKVKLFVEAITKRRIFERVGGRIGGVAKKTAKYAKKHWLAGVLILLAVMALYVFLLYLIGGKAWENFKELYDLLVHLANPQPKAAQPPGGVSSVLWGLFWVALFAAFSSPIAFLFPKSKGGEVKK